MGKETRYRLGLNHAKGLTKNYADYYKEFKEKIDAELGKEAEVVEEPKRILGRK